MKSWISTIPLFAGLSTDQLNGLAQICEDRAVLRGEMIFSDGDEGVGFYVVKTGMVKIFKVSWDGKEQILHLLGPGEPFGEVSVFAGDRFPASAQAMEEGVMVFFPRESFVSLIRGNPDLALNLLAVLSKRLRKFTALIEDLSLKEVPGRLAAYLLYMQEVRGGTMVLELDIPKNLIASLLGTIPETLSRVLGRMDKRGLIASEGSKISIKDLNGLRDLAETGGGL
ncbi:MAG: Crp/Fnr family transcriptional regulator [Desulfobacteraceae bacterium]|nr:MAG: Crp/Fnr family transcriptional regulator [Desulfobacteraceae bacterium]